MEALIALLLSAILGTLGVSGKVERGIEAQMRETLGPVKQVKVEVRRGHRSPLSRQVDQVEITLVGFDVGSLPEDGGLRIGGGGDLVGRVGSVAIHARDFRIKELPVERLDLTIKDIRYDLWKAIWRRKLEIIRVGKSSAEARLTADGLTKMVAPRVTQVEDLRLTFGYGEITVSGYVRRGVRIPVRLTCSLEPAGGKVFLVDPKAHVSIVPVPAFIVDRLMSDINPVVDLNQGRQGPFAFAIRQLLITPRDLRLRADLRPRKL
jgi:hypothetical protein